MRCGSMIQALEQRPPEAIVAALASGTSYPTSKAQPQSAMPFGGTAASARRGFGSCSERGARIIA
jgi:hypothetical protein